MKLQKRRCRRLAIPPNWKNVWIARSPSAHIQAFGEDDAGRRQYIYHPDWIEGRDAHKFDCLVNFSENLPRVRARIKRILRSSEDTELIALAAIVKLLDEGALRIGSPRYAQSSGALGATTLRASNITLGAEVIEIDFIGKGGKPRHVELQDQDLHDALEQVMDLEGPHLFDLPSRTITPTLVNDFLHDLFNDRYTAKHFRTWAGSVAAARVYRRSTETPPSLKALCEAASTRLGNTPAIAKASYIHPTILDSAREKILYAPEDFISGPPRLRVDERACHGIITRDK